MKAPKKIYLREMPNQPVVSFWYRKRGKFCDNHEYIRKDILLGWAKERYQQTISNVGCYTGHSVWQEVIDKLNSM